MEKEPKYKVGDVIQYQCEGDNEIHSMLIDRITKDEYGRYVYHRDYSKNHGSFLYEDDIICKIEFDKDEYMLYKELKAKYEEYEQ